MADLLRAFAWAGLPPGLVAFRFPALAAAAHSCAHSQPCVPRVSQRAGPRGGSPALTPTHTPLDSGLSVLVFQPAVHHGSFHPRPSIAQAF